MQHRWDWGSMNHEGKLKVPGFHVDKAFQDHKSGILEALIALQSAQLRTQRNPSVPATLKIGQHHTQHSSLHLPSPGNDPQYKAHILWRQT
jgi:hypothetical protein